MLLKVWAILTSLWTSMFSQDDDDDDVRVWWWGVICLYLWGQEGCRG